MSQACDVIANGGESFEINPNFTINKFIQTGIVSNVPLPE
jgi:hypothetical protein